MSSIKVTLPDGSVRVCEKGTTPLQVAAEIGKRLEQATVAAKVNDALYDAFRPLDEDCRLSLITKDSEDGIEVLRHSTAHLLAQAIKELYPKAQITIGPVIENGFYYDIDCPETLTADDLPKIEKKMEEVAKRNLDVSRDVWPKEKAVKFFRDQGEEYKAEIIEDLGESSVSLYAQGDFTDLCRGPHVPNTGKLGKFKLLSIAGAYWRGNEKNPMLQRIYGTAWPSQKELDAYLHRLEEAKKRDHRRLGPELGLFTFLKIAPSMPFYLPKGTQLFNLMQGHIRKAMVKRGYEEVICPQLMTSELWEKSGHAEHFKDNMFTIEQPDGSSLSLKPMNCPGHVSLFGSTKHSYRELPIRYCEFSKLHRNELGGVMHGLMRTRAFCQDDGHIFCREDQMEAEVCSVTEHTLLTYKQFGFDDISIKVATRPESYMREPANWERATEILKKSLEKSGLAFDIAEGEGAFYGPKIEFHIRDSIGRTWQCGTIQVDFNLPERFELEYVESTNQTKRPVMIHRAIFGSFERFMGIYIEHTAGRLPLWVAPVQATVINIAQDQEAYATSVAKELEERGIRLVTDLRNEKLGYKIREAQTQQIPMMIVLGPKEQETQTVSLRWRSGENINNLSIGALFELIEPELKPQEE